MLYPFEIKQKLCEFVALLSATRFDFHLVIGKNRDYYVHRYEGKLNGLKNEVVLLSYPEKAFGTTKAQRAFLSTEVSLTTAEILSCYVCWWLREVFFRQCKDKLALEIAIRYILYRESRNPEVLTTDVIAHYLWVVGTGEICSFENGYHRICDLIKLKKYHYFFRCA